METVTIDVLVCSLNGEQHMEQREVPAEWFTERENAKKESDEN